MAFDPILALILATVHLPCALVLSVIDAREHRLPNVWVLALSGAITAAGGTYALVVEEFRSPFLFAMTLAAVGTALAIALALFVPGSIGMGDAKTFFSTAACAAMLGAPVLLGSLAWICAMGAILALAVLFVTRGDLKARFAFGPVLLSAPYGGAALAALGI